jgi:hypothetical protein
MNLVVTDRAQLLVGDAGLLFTSKEPHVVTDWFATYSKPDFARTGNPATRTVTMPAGARAPCPLLASLWEA